MLFKLGKYLCLYYSVTVLFNRSILCNNNTAAFRHPRCGQEVQGAEKIQNKEMGPALKTWS